MSAYLIVSLNIKDKELFSEYAQQAGPSMLKFGAEFIARGAISKMLSGEQQWQTHAVVKFEDENKIEAWYNSAEYQALIDLRDRAADLCLAVFSDN
ncbi:DUF1330 domain-containing protein [Agaribacterium haliotis]|uniref:DUF1330 domain-containing protein n=1 Tax=Agaribacterium haliotis TaxID=2013869 RepID=UPI000BB58078|nr:DUF1330 domain-containing protein [Agaribacterium haliotis]